MFMIILLIFMKITTYPSAFVFETSLGKINAVLRSVEDGKNTYEVKLYCNIPYAKAPIGELRFKRPVPFGGWTGVRDGTKFGPSCIQPPPGKTMSSLLPNHDQSEDCLQLNIYSPQKASKANKKPVMVWIHGGGFTTGQGIVYDGTYLTGVGDVIVVTINYRLNVFGFFSTMDDLSPGNYGLWDQQLALRWIHDNIGDYGGDSNSVTIFGESAGGFSVGLHALNPDNSGLFQRIIAQSGVGNSFLTTSPNQNFATQVYANLINCLQNLNMMSCLRNKTSEELIQKFNVMLANSIKTPELRIEMAFAPVVDGEFLKDTPQKIMNGKGDGFSFYSSLDVMIGNSESEGSLLVSILNIKREKHLLDTGISWNYLCDAIISTVVSDYYNDNSFLTKPICDQYKTISNFQSMSAVNFIGDIFFYSPAVRSLNIHALHSQKSHYQYLSKRLSMFSVSQRRAKWFIGAGHASELPFLFPFSDLSGATTNDVANSILMMKYWSNFAKTGNVNGDGVPNWPQFDLNNQSYAVLYVNVTVHQELYRDRVNFWLKTIPNLHKQTNNLNSGNIVQLCHVYQLIVILLISLLF